MEVEFIISRNIYVDVINSNKRMKQKRESLRIREIISVIVDSKRVVISEYEWAS